MSLSIALEPRSLVALANEVDPLLERLRETALEGSRALTRGNLLELVQAMHERERIFLRAAPLLEELRVRCNLAKENSWARADGREEMDDVVARILKTLNGVRVSDEALMASVEELRGFTASELEHVRRQRFDQAGYAEAARTGTNLDLRR